jgi:hypothetical protein
VIHGGPAAHLQNVANDSERFLQPMAELHGVRLLGAIAQNGASAPTAAKLPG